MLSMRPSFDNISSALTQKMLHKQNTATNTKFCGLECWTVSFFLLRLYPHRDRSDMCTYFKLKLSTTFDAMRTHPFYILPTSNVISCVSVFLCLSICVWLCLETKAYNRKENGRWNVTHIFLIYRFSRKTHHSEYIEYVYAMGIHENIFSKITANK